MDERDSGRVGGSGAGGSGELKIRGQAEVERRKSKWDEAPAPSADVRFSDSVLKVYGTDSL